MVERDDGIKDGVLEPRSHGGLRLSGDLPGRFKNRWRVLGIFTLHKRRMFHDGELILYNSRGPNET